MSEKVVTLEEVRAQIAAREEELAEHQDEYGDPVGVLAREEALERLCDALGYMERSLAEATAAKLALSAEHDAIIREAIQAKGAAARLAREVESEAQARVRLEADLEAQRAKQQRAWAEAQTLRAELASVRMAQREVERQLEVDDATVEAPSKAPITG